jgi:hypothetical protein
VNVLRFAALPPIALALACATAPPPPPPAPASLLEPFSGARAYEQLAKLAEIGPRVAGTPGGAQARALLRAELEALGLTVHEEPFVYAPEPEGRPHELANLWVEVPGRYPGLFAVGTPFDTSAAAGTGLVGVNEGASGAAVLLELARVLRDRPLDHTVRLYFLDGELFDPAALFLGSEHAYLGLDEAGALSELRLFLYLHMVGDAELEVRRDRLSDRRLRDAFYAAAARGGFEEAFPSSGPFDAIRLGNSVFSAHGFSRVVAFADLRYGGDAPPGTYWRTVDDDLSHCSPESLTAVGSVVRAGLGVLSERQATVDRIRGVPLRAEASEPPPDASVDPFEAGLP